MTVLSTLLEDLPIGTNLALLYFMWMLVSGALLPNRGAWNVVRIRDAAHQDIAWIDEQYVETAQFCSVNLALLQDEAELVRA